MKKKKIAFVIHSMSYGGAERVISILGNHFSTDYDVFIISLIDSPSFYELNSSELYCIASRGPNQRKMFSMH